MTCLRDGRGMSALAHDNGFEFVSNSCCLHTSAVERIRWQGFVESVPVTVTQARLKPPVSA